jgi:hypothetical protein
MGVCSSSYKKELLASIKFPIFPILKIKLKIKEKRSRRNESKIP